MAGESANDLAAVIGRLNQDPHVKAAALGWDAGVDRGCVGVGGASGDGDYAKRVPMACVADVLEAVAALQLIQAGRLDLDQPIAELLGGVAAKTRRGLPIKVRHLLSRTSGLRAPKVGSAVADLDDFFSRAEAIFSPGSVFIYQGADLVLLRAIISEVSGQAFADYALSNILEPLAIETKCSSKKGYPQWLFSPNDLLTLSRAIVPSASRFGEPILDAGSVAILTEQAVTIRRSSRELALPHTSWAFTHGLFLYSDGLTGLGGNERGYACGFRVDPRTGASMVASVEGPYTVRDTLVSALAETLGYVSEQTFPSGRAVGRLLDVDLADVAGVYEGWAEGALAKIAVTGDRFRCEMILEGELFREVDAIVGADGHLFLCNDARYPSWLEFFRDAAFGRPCFTQHGLAFAQQRAEPT